MKAMHLKKLGTLSSNPSPLELGDLPTPELAQGEILVRVTACGVCRTELDEVEGRLPPTRLPIVPGHQIVGVVDALGPSGFEERGGLLAGQRVGIAWIYSACGRCEFCRAGLENLCPEFKATGCDVDGGYAQLVVVPAAFAHPLPDSLSDLDAAPLLCAGAIGYRAVRLSQIGEGQILGLMGFGASGHLVLKMLHHRYPTLSVFVFSRMAEQIEFARALGASWAGEISQPPPAKMDAVIDTTPAWLPVIQALQGLKPGGRLIINAIRKEPDDRALLANLDYSAHLWLEREVKSVANITRSDVREFLALAAEAGLKPDVTCFDLDAANDALMWMKRGGHTGAGVLVI